MDFVAQAVATLIGAMAAFLLSKHGDGAAPIV